jgi:hypothetical protein
MQKQTDLLEFTRAWKKMGLHYRREVEAAEANLAYGLLAEYELDEVRQAMHRAARVCRFMPVAADIIAQIRGELPRAVSQYGLAQNADTILGIKVLQMANRLHLAQLSARDGIQRIESLQVPIKKFVFDWQNGDIRSTDLALIVKAGIDVCEPLCFGLPGVRPPFQDAISNRAAIIAAQKQLAHEKQGLDEHEPMSLERRRAMAKAVRSFTASLRSANSDHYQKSVLEPIAAPVIEEDHW